MKQPITAWEARLLRQLGFSYREIGDLLGVSTGTAYRLCQKPASYVEKRGNKRRLEKRHVLPLWEKHDPQLVARVFYFLVPRWVAERYSMGTQEHEYCLDLLLDALWRFENLQRAKEEDDFVRLAYGFVHRRVWGDLRWISETKKQAELFYTSLEEAGLTSEREEEE